MLIGIILGIILSVTILYVEKKFKIIENIVNFINKIRGE